MRLKLMVLNTQDLFLRLAYPLAPGDLTGLSEAQWQQLAAGEEALKPLARLRGLARVFADERPDVALLCEVGGDEALRTFNRLFLGEAYEPYFVAGNSDRGIDCAYLVRKGLGVRIEIESHRDVPVTFSYPHEVDPAGLRVTALVAAHYPLPPPGQRRMARDVPELRLYPLAGPPTGAAAAATAAATPGLVLLMAHLKSAFDPEGFDPRGVARRTGEVKTLLALRAAVQARVGAGVPVLVAGDLNGLAARRGTDAEFAPLYAQTDLEDALEIAGHPAYERISHLTFFDGQVHARQLDYLFIPAALKAHVDAAGTYVYRYRFEGAGDEVQLPLSMRDRAYLPSDHYPLVCVVDVATLDPPPGPPAPASVAPVS